MHGKGGSGSRRIAYRKIKRVSSGWLQFSLPNSLRAGYKMKRIAKCRVKQLVCCTLKARVKKGQATTLHGCKKGSHYVSLFGKNAAAEN
jgi:hypothetical protein